LCRWYPGREHLDPKLLEVYRNLLENPFIVHFNHRTIATLTLATVLCKLFILY